MTLPFENEPTTLEFIKTDLTTGKELAGAKLKITDSEGNVVDEWESTETPHVIKELVVGREYTMTETKPVDGYVTAESITFTVENTAEVQKHEMQDDVTKVEISKKDLTNGDELPGAKLTILNEKGEVVKSWTSTDKPHYIEKLPIGKYTLREETAPEGYLVAEDVAFEITDTPEIQKVEMKDEAKPTTPEQPGTPSETPDSPKTGDDRQFGVWILLMVLALCGVGGSVYYLRKKSH